jgi:hypothetical protein
MITNFFLSFKNATWVSKNTEFDANFESFEKVAKNLGEKVTKNGVFYFYYSVQKFSAYNFLLNPKLEETAQKHE